MNRRLRRHLGGWLGAIMVVSASACGTRVDQEAANRSGDPAAAGAPTPADAPADFADPSGAAGSAADRSSSSNPTAQPGAGGGAAPPPAGSRSAEAAVPAPARPVDTSSSKGAGGATAPTSPGRATGRGAAPAPPGGPPAVAVGGARSPVLLASVGTLSGPAGGAFVPMVQGAQIWVRTVNDRGGLSGHPVRLTTYDDGGDPARHRALVQEAVERGKAVAFLMNTEYLTGEGSLDYINAKRIPVIGTDGGASWVFSSPMYFPQMSAGRGAYVNFGAMVKDQLVARGKTRIGTLVCVESSSCGEFAKAMADQAATFGYQVVYQGRTSLAQPDFTADCLAARNAGVQALAMILDASSVTRVANSCARQGFHPTFMQPAQGATDHLKDEPNLDGMLTPSPIFPFFQSGTPATDEYQAAVRKFGGGIPPGAGAAAGWTAGKLFERAAARLAQPPTTAAVLAGLWSLRDDTLDGLTMPLTFQEGKPARPGSCWFTLAITDRKWTSPDGFRLRCHPAS